MLFGREKPTYLTCRGRDDGGGAQIMACLSTMIAARLRGVRYAHTPLEQVAHAPESSDETRWAEEWERFFSLGDGEVAAADLADLRLHPLTKPHRQRPRRGRLNVVAHCHKLTDRHPVEWARLAPEIRRKYHLTPKPDGLARDPSGPTVAVHLRRGDVDESGRFSERFTPIGRLVPHLRELAQQLAPRTPVVHLFSQGAPEDFAGFDEFAPVLHLDEEVFGSFHAMTTADILFTAKSTFSHLAGLIGDGLVVHEPFWHPPLPHWQSLDAHPATVAAAIASRIDPCHGRQP